MGFLNYLNRDGRYNNSAWILTFSNYIEPTSKQKVDVTLFQSLVALGIFPITNSYGRYVEGSSAVDTWIAVRGVGVAALGLRRLPATYPKFDHSWRFAGFLELHHVPLPVS